jgi:REP element-mobilizing transposase RayT
MTEERTFYDRKRPAHQSMVEHSNSSRIVFLTVCTEKRKQILCNDKIHQLLAESWKKADAWLVGRYILMPDHLHLFCSPVGLEYPSLKKWVQYWKSISATAWPDADLGKVWQRDFWDTQLRKGESYTDKWRYVVHNPVRAGLVDDASLWPHQGEMNVLQWHD